MSQLVRLEGKHTTQNAHCAVVQVLSKKLRPSATITSSKLWVWLTLLPCVPTIWITAKQTFESNLQETLSFVNSSSLAGVLNLLKYIAFDRLRISLTIHLKKGLPPYRKAGSYWLREIWCWPLIGRYFYQYSVYLEKYWRTTAKINQSVKK